MVYCASALPIFVSIGSSPTKTAGVSADESKPNEVAMSGSGNKAQISSSSSPSMAGITVPAPQPSPSGKASMKPVASISLGINSISIRPLSEKGNLFSPMTYWVCVRDVPIATTVNWLLPFTLTMIGVIGLPSLRA